jgi:hypothetical protein
VTGTKRIHPVPHLPTYFLTDSPPPTQMRRAEGRVLPHQPLVAGAGRHAQRAARAAHAKGGRRPGRHPTSGGGFRRTGVDSQQLQSLAHPSLCERAGCPVCFSFSGTRACLCGLGARVIEQGRSVFFLSSDLTERAHANALMRTCICVFCDPQVIVNTVVLTPLQLAQFYIQAWCVCSVFCLTFFLHACNQFDSGCMQRPPKLL